MGSDIASLQVSKTSLAWTLAWTGQRLRVGHWTESWEDGDERSMGFVINEHMA